MTARCSTCVAIIFLSLAHLMEAFAANWIWNLRHSNFSFVMDVLKCSKEHWTSTHSFHLVFIRFTYKKKACSKDFSLSFSLVFSFELSAPSKIFKAQNESVLPGDYIVSRFCTSEKKSDWEAVNIDANHISSQLFFCMICFWNFC